MKRRNFLTGMFLLLSLVLGHIPVATSQGTTPIDVFLDYEPETLELSIYFSNPATGLSAVTTVPNFPPTLNPLDEVKLSANGVIFRNPTDGRPYLITPTGRSLAISFIPQLTEPLTLIDWAISEDGRTLAWAEIRFNALGWQSNLFVAQLDGQNYRALPERPILPIQASHRVAMLAVSNGGARVFYDAEHLPTLPQGNLFEGFQRVTAYLERVQTYFDLPEEPQCVCPALIANDGFTMYRLQPSTDPEINGFEVHIWNLENNRERIVPAIDSSFDQVGNPVINTDGSFMMYMVADEDSDSPLYSLMLVDMISLEQRLVGEPQFVALRPMAIIDNNTQAIVVSVENNLTYKLQFEDGTLTPIADKLWIGTIQG